MRRWRIAPLAEQDIDSIWRYSVEQWGSEQAERYIELIRAAIEEAAAHPLRVAIARTQYRRIKAGSHSIFYRVGQNGILVVRVLHERQDSTLHLN